LAYYTDMDNKLVYVQIETYCFEWITFLKSYPLKAIEHQNR
jgi:hypothetical protein